MGIRVGRRSAVALAVTAIVGFAGSATSIEAAASPRFLPHPSGGSGWTQLSSGTLGISQDIGVARFGSQIQLVWSEAGAGAKRDLLTRIVGSDGSPVSAPITVQSGWSTLNGHPVVLGNDGQRLIGFAGVQNGTSSNPYSKGYEYYATSPDGTSWTLSPGSMSGKSSAYSSYGTDAVDAGGTPVLGYTSSSANAITYHSGLIATIPTTLVNDPTTTPAAHCCTYHTGLGYDATSQATWAVWFSNSGDATTNGVLAQQIQPTLGAQFQAPGSNAIKDGKSNSVDPNQRIATAARIGGGVFAAYPDASRQKVALWKLGTAGALTRSAEGNAYRVGAAAGPDGRIWIYWWNAGTSIIHFARTNPQISRFGTACEVKSPAATTNVWKLAGNASQGPLQLFTLAGASNAQIYGTVIKPCLTVSVSPSSVAGSSGGTFTVKVSDAGSPVSGAKVSFEGKSRTTTSTGKVSFTVAKHHAAGTPKVLVTKSGYQPGAGTVHIS